MGLEPTRSFEQRILNPPRLPIPSFPHYIFGADSGSRTHKLFRASDFKSDVFTKVSPYLLFFYFLVRKVGLEPTRSFEQRILNPSRLPTPSFPHYILGVDDRSRTCTSYDTATSSRTATVSSHLHLVRKVGLEPTRLSAALFENAKTTNSIISALYIWCRWWDSNPHVLSNNGF